MNILTVLTKKTTASEAADDIKNRLADFPVKMLVYFASWEAYDHDEISAQMHAAFPEAVVFGCCSHAELFNGATVSGAVTAMAFNAEVIEDVKVEILENLQSSVDIAPAFQAFDDYFDQPMQTADYRKFGGIILVDGLSAKEEEVMDKIGDRTNILFTGGSASDPFKFDSTYVYANGKAYRNAALLAVFKAKNGLDVIKTQSVDITDTVLTVTKADPANRLVMSLDNQPAAQRYAQVLGVDRSEIEDYFFSTPLGLVVGSDVYVRDFMKCEGDSISLFCSILEGMDYHLLKMRDIIPDTQAAVEAKKAELGNIAGIIDFRCAFRTLQLDQQGTTEAYEKIFDGIPMIGFSTYGEEFLGHMNSTSTMIVFK